MTQLTQYTQSTQFDISSATDAGPTGKENEDSYTQFEIPAQNTMGELSKILIGVVADGIGGEAGGREASQIAVDTIQASLLNDGATPIGERLGRAVLQANHIIYTRSESSTLYNSMGTTIVAAAIDGNTLHVVHAGDSRAYLIRNQRAIRLTQDHSWVQEAIDAGRYTLAEAKAHPNRNVIKRYLGIEERIEVDHELRDPDSVFANIQSGGSVEARVPMVQQVQLQPNDVVLLCTDGLNDVVTDEQIERIVEPLSLHKSAEKLVNTALKQGTTDNTTVQLIGPKQPAMAVGASAASALTGSSVNGPRSRLIAGAGITSLLIALAAAIYFLLLNPSLNVPVDDRLVSEQPTVAVAATSDADSSEPTQTLESNSSSQVATDDSPTDSIVKIAQDSTATLIAKTAINTATPVPPTATNTDEPKPATPEPEAAAVQNSDADRSDNGLVSDATTAQPSELDKDAPNSEGSGNESASTIATYEAAALGDVALTSTLTSTPLPTSTPVPTTTPLPPTATNTATPQSTATSSPTSPATSTPVPEQPTATSSIRPTATIAVPTATSTSTATVFVAQAVPLQPTVAPAPPPTIVSASINLPTSVTILNPQDGFTLSSSPTVFEWRSDLPLPPGYMFEPVFWKDNQTAMQNGSGYKGSTQINSIKISEKDVIDAPGAYNWGVLLVKSDPYKRVKFLGGGRKIVKEGNSQGGGSNTSSPPTNTPPPRSDR